MSSATVFGKAVPAENGAHTDRVLILDAGAQYGKVNFINASTAIKALSNNNILGNRSKSA